MAYYEYKIIDFNARMQIYIPGLVAEMCQLFSVTFMIPTLID